MKFAELEKQLSDKAESNDNQDALGVANDVMEEEDLTVPGDETVRMYT